MRELLGTWVPEPAYFSHPVLQPCCIPVQRCVCLSVAMSAGYLLHFYLHILSWNVKSILKNFAAGALIQVFYIPYDITNPIFSFKRFSCTSSSGYKYLYTLFMYQFNQLKILVNNVLVPVQAVKSTCKQCYKKKKKEQKHKTNGLQEHKVRRQGQCGMLQITI